MRPDESEDSVQKPYELTQAFWTIADLPKNEILGKSAYMGMFCWELSTAATMHRKVTLMSFPTKKLTKDSTPFFTPLE